MKPCRPALLLAALLVVLGAAPRLAARTREASSEYAARRARLLERVSGPVVLFAYSGT